MGIDKLKVLDKSLPSQVTVSDVKIGDGAFAFMAGPCAVESYEQLYTALLSAKNSGANILRAGAYKLRTSPYSFSGLGDAGLEMLISISKELNMPVVTELPSTDHIELFKNVDIIQIGARNMQNLPMLNAVGKTGKPVLLKRGFSSTIEELLLSAEYIINTGNTNIILCERGIRTFETATRNTFDISSIAYLKNRTNLPIVADPSHATGLSELVRPMSKAAIAAGADGIMVETHPHPENALSDGMQAISPDELNALSNDIKKYLNIESKFL